MLIITIQLKDIIIDPLSKVDLLSIPAEEAAKLIKESYGFLSAAIEVTVENNIAVISLKEPKAEQVNEALKTYKKALQEAKQGAYNKAIRHFQQVIEVMPEHTEARRNLAMAHLEAGNVQKAREYLLQCIKLEPENAWSYVLLGNIYTKHEHNLEVAEFYYEKGLSINQQDNFLLNNYAVLKMEQGKMQEAEELFEKARSSDPAYPNTYYGLALLHNAKGELKLALKTLDALYSQPTAKDIRSGQIYQQAQNLYLEINKQLAEKNTIK